jgi:hypothetical protein
VAVAGFLAESRKKWQLAMNQSLRAILVTRVKLVASSPGLSRRSRQDGTGSGYRDGQDKPGHDRMGCHEVFQN